MTTKKLLSLAIIAALPLGARADWTENGRTYHPVDTPAQVASNGQLRTLMGPMQLQQLVIMMMNISHLPRMSKVPIMILSRQLI